MKYMYIEVQKIEDACWVGSFWTFLGL